MYGRSVGRSDGNDVITKPKFFALMGLPKSLSYGAPLARALGRARELRYNNFRGHSEKKSKTGVYFTVVSLFKTIHCRISFKLQQNTAKFVERILLLSFQRENNRIL